MSRKFDVLRKLQEGSNDSIQNTAKVSPMQLNLPGLKPSSGAPEVITERTQVGSKESQKEDKEIKEHLNAIKDTIASERAVPKAKKTSLEKVHKADRLASPGREMKISSSHISSSGSIGSYFGIASPFD